MSHTIGSISGYELPEDDYPRGIPGLRPSSADEFVDNPVRECQRGCGRPMTMFSESGDCLECALEGARAHLAEVMSNRPNPMTYASFNEESKALIEVAKLIGAVEAHKPRSRKVAG